MLQFALNLSILLREVSFLERFEYAARLGFTTVEFWWPGNKNLTAITSKIDSTKLNVALINLDAGDTYAGERGYINDRNQQKRFRSHVPVAMEFAADLGCLRLNALVGNILKDRDLEAQFDQIKENLAWVADYAALYGITIVVEALNSFETLIIFLQVLIIH